MAEPGKELPMAKRNIWAESLAEALGAVDGWGLTIEQEDAMTDLLRMFEDYEGDKDAHARPMLAAECRNCAMRWPVMPAGTYVEATKLGLMAIRKSSCPRCFATVGIVLKGDWP